MGYQHIAMLVTFAGYLVLLLFIGYLGDRKHSKSYEDFVSAGKSLGAWTTALSSAASSESAWAILGLSGLGFFVGLPALWAVLGCVLGFVVNALFVIRQLRAESDRLGAITLSDYIESRLNDKSKSLRIVSALMITFFMGVYVVAQFVGAGKILYEMEIMGPGTSYQAGVAIGAIIVGVYIFMGGYAAVCWTDSVQGVLMLLVMVGLPGYALYLAGGPLTVWDILVGQQDALAATSLLGWGGAGFIFAQASVGMGYQGMPHMVIRYITVKDDKAAGAAGVISVAWSAIALTGSAVLGITCRALYPLNEAGCSVAGFCAENQKAAESVISFFAMHSLHPVFAGLVLAAVSAAIMSTADSQLMYAATALVNDFWLRIRPTRLGHRQLVWATRGVVAAITAVAAVVALQEIKVIYSFVLFAWGALGSAFTPIVLLSLYWKKFHRWGAMACMLAGPGSVVIWHMDGVKAALVQLDPTLYSGVFELIPACGISALAGILVSAVGNRFDQK